MNTDTQNKKQTKKGALSFIFLHSAGIKRWLIFAIVASLLSTAATFVMPQVIRFAVDTVIGGRESELTGLAGRIANRILLASTKQQALIRCAAAVVVFSFAAGIFNFFSRMSVAKGTEKFCKNLRDKLFRHVEYLPFKWQVENQTGDTIQRCTSDLDVIRGFVSGQLLEVVRTAILIGMAMVLMFSMNVTLSLISMAFIPLIIGYSLVFFWLVGKRFLAADEAEGALTVNVQENLTGVRVVRAFGREKYELERFDKYNNGFANLWIKLGHTLSLYWAIGDVATGLQIFSVVAAGAVLAANGTITVGEYLVFVSYNQALVWPVRALGRTLSEMSKTGVSATRIQEILDAETEPEEPDALHPPLHKDIKFDNVTFGYDGSPVLKNLNFTIPKGTTFGILGATGSGKSTITYLLNRLYELPKNSGTIWFGDVEISNIDRYYLRKNVGLVLQEPFLFSKSLQENIQITVQSEDLEKVRKAASIAAVDHSIMEFTDGYDTVVGERGVTLSGGQKQRVAIARTLMLEAPVMVFDDSMSAVDLETDAKIRDALKKNTGKSTVILISHRINTLMHADNIMILKDGMIEDIGTHSELIKREGTYKRIYDMQSEAAQDGGLQKGDTP